MSSPSERAAYEQAHIRWAASDIEGFLDLFTEDVLYNVNVDGLAVPYASSALGKEDVRQRLQFCSMSSRSIGSSPRSLWTKAITGARW